MNYEVWLLCGFLIFSGVVFVLVALSRHRPKLTEGEIEQAKARLREQAKQVTPRTVSRRPKA